jgi:hypothetical protein
MSDADDKQLESYLKNFRPVDPEPLPLRTKTHSVSGRRRSALAISAVACLAAIALVFILMSRGPDGANEQSPSRPFGEANLSSANNDAKRVEIPTPVLTKLAFDDHRAFDQFMTEKFQSQFPPMKSERSVLRVLAEE